MKTKNIRILVTEDFKKEVEQAANQDSKTLTSYVIDCILVDLRKRRKNARVNKD